MLVLASAVLIFEAIGVGAAVKTGERNDNNDGAKEKADTSGNERLNSNSSDGGGCWVRVWTGRFVYGIAGLSWWMLFMTAIWFHTWLEKVSVSVSGLWMLANCCAVVWLVDRPWCCVYHLLPPEESAVVEEYRRCTGSIAGGEVLT